MVLWEAVEPYHAGLVALVERGTPVIQAVQRYRTPFRDRLFATATLLAGQPLYSFVFPFLQANAGAAFYRRLCYLTVFMFYSTAVIKDVLRLPRPNRKKVA